MSLRLAGDAWRDLCGDEHPGSRLLAPGTGQLVKLSIILSRSCETSKRNVTKFIGGLEAIYEFLCSWELAQQCRKCPQSSFLQPFTAQSIRGMIARCFAAQHLEEMASPP